uniref:Uncharacterized protein n=1 Tax=Schlesneria paludicola TaxID=360056 RepID=A0A7C4QL60_9PLAN
MRAIWGERDIPGGCPLSRQGARSTAHRSRDPCGRTDNRRRIWQTGQDRLSGRDARMPGCQDARMPGCQDARMPGCQDVSMSACQHARMPVTGRG